MITKPKPGFMINHLHPLSRGLVGWWLFNEGGGPIVRNQVTDISHGTIVGQESATAWRGSNFGGTVGLGGTDDYIQISTPPVIEPPFSISAWFLTRSTAFQTVVQLQDTDDTDRKHLLGIDSTTVQAFSQQNGGTNGAAILTTTVPLRILQHVCGVWHSNSLREVYFNGIFGASNSTTVTTDAIDSMSIGMARDSTPTDPLNGFVDNVMVYNRVLLPTEIQQLATIPYANVISPLNSQSSPNSPLILGGSLLNGNGGMPGDPLAGIGNLFRRRRRLHR